MFFLNWQQGFVGSLLMLVASSSNAATDLRGSIGLETRAFTTMDFSQSSLVLESDWYWESADSSYAWKFKPFARLDDRDDDRTHLDLREFYFQYSNSQWEFRIGINKVFWGVTESQHLVDVINQTDFLEGFEGEDKLGQPMIQLTSINNWGTLDVFVLPYFRDRRFPGHAGGFNHHLILETAQGRQTLDAYWLAPNYESSLAERHTDIAFRYSHAIGPWDLGISYFDGTAREPRLAVESFDLERQRAYWSQTYLQMRQSSIDLQATLGAWLWKLEAVARNWGGEHYSAMSSGFEYTYYGVNADGADLGLLLEWNFDSRDQQASNPNQNDVFAGVRFSFNNPQSTEVLIGVSSDLDNHNSYMGKIEANHRIGDRMKLTIEGWFFKSDNPVDPVYFLSDDDYVQLSLELFF